MRLAGSRLQHHPSRVGLTKDTKAGPVWTGEVRFNEQWLTQPLRWKRPRKIFVAAHGDLFHENVPDDVLDRVFAVMALSPQHTFQVLTKRADRMRRYFHGCLPPPPNVPLRNPWVTQWHRFKGVHKALNDLRQAGYSDLLGKITTLPLPNVWLGVSVEDQRRADERIPDLLATPAAVRWISAEPLLGPVNLHEYLLGFSAGHPASCACGHGHGFTRCPNYGRVSKSCHRCSCTEFRKAPGSDGLSWVVVGGESGPGARPMHPDWARSLRDQCAAAGVPFLFKQHGSWLGRSQGADDETCKRFPHIGSANGQDVLYRVGKKAAGRLLDGVTHDEFPEAAQSASLAEGSRRG